MVAVSAATSGSRKNSIAKEDADSKTDNSLAVQQTVTTIVTTKSGRASKPSTPALGNFPEHARARSARNNHTDKAKRSHKKGASLQAALAAQAVDEDAEGGAHGDDDGDIDANEPRYCYCDGVSYGEMVACDADDCEKEWFHLGCVGLKSAPGSSSKCENPVPQLLIPRLTRGCARSEMVLRQLQKSREEWEESEQQVVPPVEAHSSLCFAEFRAIIRAFTELRSCAKPKLRAAAYAHDGQGITDWGLESRSRSRLRKTARSLNMVPDGFLVRRCRPWYTLLDIIEGAPWEMLQGLRVGATCSVYVSKL